MQAVCQGLYRRESGQELTLCLYKKQTCEQIKSHVFKHLENHVLQLNKMGHTAKVARTLSRGDPRAALHCQRNNQGEACVAPTIHSGVKCLFGVGVQAIAADFAV